MNIPLNIIPYNKARIYQNNSVYFGQGQKSALLDTGVQNSLYSKSSQTEQGLIIPCYDLAAFYKIPSVKKYGRDDLTGLRGKGHLLSRLESRMEEAKKNNANLSIAMFDMDNFKSINDLLGYDTGDIFIQTTAKHIHEIAKKNNVGSYRFGGEEFIIMFNGEKLSKVKDIASEVCQSVLNDPLLLSYKSEYLSVVNKRLENLTSEKEELDVFIELKTKYEGLKEFKQKYIEDTNDNDSSYVQYINETLSKKRHELKHVSQKILNKAAINEGNSEVKKMLTDNENALNSDDVETQERVFADKNLNEYLKAIYGHAFDIAQLKQWKRCVEHTDGFSITAGIKEFAPADLNKTSEEVISEAGEVLKKGKNKQKGLAYI